MRQNTRRIICVGSRLIEDDRAGPLVYDYLTGQEMPAAVQLVEGGLAGLDLIRFIEDADRVIIVDSTAGFDPNREIIVLTLQEVVEATSCTALSHRDGLVYLLHAIPEICTDYIPEIFFVGVQGYPRTQIIQEAAETSLHLAMDMQ